MQCVVWFLVCDVVGLVYCCVWCVVWIGDEMFGVQVGLVEIVEFDVCVGDVQFVFFVGECWMVVGCEYMVVCVCDWLVDVLVVVVGVQFVCCCEYCVFGWFVDVVQLLVCVLVCDCVGVVYVVVCDEMCECGLVVIWQCCEQCGWQECVCDVCVGDECCECVEFVVLCFVWCDQCCVGELGWEYVEQ